MTSLFDGLGVWSFWFEGVGTPLTPADCQEYKAAGVDWIAVKVSDGVTGGGQVSIEQIQLVEAAGLRSIPWAYLYGNLPVSAQLATLKAAGGGSSGPYILNIEQAVLVAELAPVAAVSAVATWGDPQSFPGQPSIGQLADIGVAAIMPEAYSGAWKLTPTQAVARAVADYEDLRLSRLPPLLPINDSAGMLEFAQAAKAKGCLGVSAWRHGANGIGPQALSGVAQVFSPPVPSPAPPPTPGGPPVANPTPGKIAPFTYEVRPLHTGMADSVQMDYGAEPSPGGIQIFQWQVDRWQAVAYVPIPDRPADSTGFTAEADQTYLVGSPLPLTITGAEVSEVG